MIEHEKRNRHGWEMLVDRVAACWTVHQRLRFVSIAPAPAREQAGNDLPPIVRLELAFGKLDGAVALAPPDFRDDFVGHV
jgi:hypothetical protein